MALIVGLAWSGPGAAKQAYIVTDARTGEVIDSSHADAHHPPASLTKMMVLYMAFEAVQAGTLSMDQMLPVSARAAGQRPSRLGLRRGQSIPLKDAILAMITKSANDATVAVAEALGGTESKFARQMTLRARKMGMSRTTFRNATGLHSRGQISSARDMARLAQALYTDFPQFYDLFATREFSFAGRSFLNHNRLLDVYEGVDGIKTGYVRASGYNVAVSAERDGRRVIAVFLGGRTAKTRDRYVAALLNKTFATLPPVTEAALAVDGGEAAADEDGGASAIDDAGLPLPAGALVATVEGNTPAAHSEGDRDDDEGATAVPDEARRWAIQIGAYYQRRLAQRAAARTLDGLPGWFEEDQIAILPIAVKRGTVHRARIYGLTEARAGEACQLLHKLGRRCQVVAPDGSDAKLVN